jgi:hypothetical protein
MPECAFFSAAVYYGRLLPIGAFATARDLWLAGERDVCRRRQRHTKTGADYDTEVPHAGAEARARIEDLSSQDQA